MNNVTSIKEDPGRSPLVSVVLLNWNGEQHVHRCLQHVLNQSHRRIEVIVVDNGSTDGSLQKVKQQHPNLVFIENRTNRGFAAGMNQGIARANGEYVIPLNQDVCMHREFIARCVSRIAVDPSIGTIGGRVFAWIGDELTGNLRRGEGEHFVMRKRFQGDGGNVVDYEKWTFAATGSFPFFRKTMLDDLMQCSGCYFDEAYETGWEDCDLFFRMHLRGWKCLFLPGAYGWHVGSGSVGGNDTFLTKSLDYQVRILRNRYFTIMKDLPVSVLMWLLPYLVATEAALVPYFLWHSPKSIIALGRAWREVLRASSALRRKRDAIQSSRKVSPDYLKQYFVRF